MHFHNQGEDCPFGDPFLEDGFGNLTRWRLSDLNKDYVMHLESESSKPKTQEKKYSKEENLKLYNYRMEQYMKAALKKYNNEENHDEGMCFEFVESRKESSIIEEDNFYQHFNFVAKQACSTIVLFFAEVIPDGGSCDVICCKRIQDNDNGRCLGCKNQGDPELRHPTSDNVYVGGHEDCMWPFLSESDSDSENELRLPSTVSSSLESSARRRRVPVLYRRSDRELAEALLEPSPGRQEASPSRQEASLPRSTGGSGLVVDVATAGEPSPRSSSPARIAPTLRRAGAPARVFRGAARQGLRYCCSEMPRPLPVGSLIREDSSVDFSRFKLLSVDDLVPTEEAATHCDEEIVREGATATHEHGDEKIIYEGATSTHEYGSDDPSDDDEDIGDPFLVDEFGNLTQWKLSDLNKQFGKHLDDELNEPKTKEKKQSKEDRLKWHNDRMELYMKSSIKKYNQEKNLDEGFCFEFVKVLKESFIVEGGCKFYRHFNFEAMQSGTSISLFFAEVIPDGENCEVTCCKLLEDDDNGRCLGCNNQGHPDLNHPASGNVYVGGRENCMFPFLIDSDSEDDNALREELLRYGRS